MDEALAQWNDKARVSASPEGIKAHLGLALRLASGKLKAGGSKSLLFVPLECSFYLVKKQGGVEEITQVEEIRTGAAALYIVAAPPT
jgi:hypothetical protein